MIFQSTYTYDNVGNLDTVTAPNGNVTDYDYTSVNQLWQLNITNASNETLSHYVYELDATGRRELITEHHSGRVIDNVYDNLYRLTGENITDPINGNYHANYQYDLVGNRTYETVDGVQTAYSYNANDWLLQTGGTTFGYDDNGNTVAETLDGVTTTYTYNAQNQMVETNRNDVITQYGYNPSGIRSQKVENAGTAEEVTIDYLVEENRDYAQVLQETENGDITVSYQYGHDLISQTRNSGVSFYQYDGLGSVRQLTDETGSLTDTYDYEAFGTVLNQTGDTENSYLYTGEQYDAGLDQYYLRARYYDQGIGRFTQMDTWMGRNDDPASLHKYVYVKNKPTWMVDPSGNVFSMVSLAQNIHARMSVAAIQYPRVALALEVAAGVATPMEIAALTPVTAGLVAGGTLTVAAAKHLDDAARLAQSSFWLNRIRSGNEFEKFVGKLISQKPNTQAIINGAFASGRPLGSAIPDFFYKGGILEAKLSGGAVKKNQLLQFAQYVGDGGHVTNIFKIKPSPAKIAEMQKWLKDAGRNIDLLIAYLFD